MSGHTPGPWTIHPYSGKGTVEAKDGVPAWQYRTVTIGAGEKIVADALMSTLEPRHGGYPRVDNDEEVFANAHLLSAAPDLYDSLQLAAGAYCSLMCPSTFRSDDEPRHTEQCDAIRAAIAKAEGR